MLLEEALINYVVDYNGCWLWASGLFANGYGQVYIQKNNGTKGKTLKAHRVFYEFHLGIIPKHLVIDHLCCRKSCVNPSHLEVVTSRENTMRSPIAPATKNKMKTHCNHGHLLSLDNIYSSRLKRRNERHCKICARDRSKEKYNRDISTGLIVIKRTRYNGAEHKNNVERACRMFIDNNTVSHKEVARMCNIGATTAYMLKKKCLTGEMHD